MASDHDRNQWSATIETVKATGTLPHDPATLTAEKYIYVHDQYGFRFTS
jgi:hypothetical protein